MNNNPNQPEPAKPASFAKLWLQAQHALGGFVFLHVPDHHLADDIIQEVAELAAERFEQYDQSRPFIAWLIGIARNRIAQAYREAAWKIGAAQAAERVDHSAKFGPIVVEPSQ